MTKNFILLSLIAFSFGIPILGQVKKDTTLLSEIKVKASPIQMAVQNAAYSVSVIGRPEINTIDGVLLTSILNKIPGVFMQQGALNTSRITIRGIGSREQYGTTKLKAYFEEIPLTTAEGESNIEDIDLESIGGIEIINGPNTTSFGSGLGGVIHLLAREASLDKLNAKSTITYGSYGLSKQTLSTISGSEKFNLFSNYSHLQSDGFRQNSSYDRKSFNIHGKGKISNKESLSLIAVLTRMKAAISSSISEEDFQNNPEKAAFTWAASKGYELYNKFLLGVGYNYQLCDNLRFASSIFLNNKKTYEPRPFNILEDKTNTFGLRSTLNYKNTLLSLPIEISIGTEIASEKYGFSLIENLYLSHPNQGSVAGAEFSKMKQNRNYSNYFLQTELMLSETLDLETGLAYNTTRYTLQDVFEPTKTNPKQSYTFGSVWSPRVGLSYKITKSKNIYSSISKGFSIPTVAETLTPGGQINTDLKPEIGWNYELGFKGKWFDKKLNTEMAVYNCQITNLLVARRVSDDEYIGINAGASSHIGFEYTFKYQLINTSQWQGDINFSGTVNNFKFKDFVEAGNDYSGNKLTNVPSQQWNIGLNASTKNGYKVNANFRTVGKIPMNDENSKYNNGYSLLDVKTSYVFTILKFLETELSIGVNNVGNTHYAASILPNAVGVGKSPARWYYPGNSRNYYVGISMSYLL